MHPVKLIAARLPTVHWDKLVKLIAALVAVCGLNMVVIGATSQRASASVGGTVSCGFAGQHIAAARFIVAPTVARLDNIGQTAWVDITLYGGFTPLTFGDALADGVWRSLYAPGGTRWTYYTLTLKSVTAQGTIGAVCYRSGPIY